MHKIKIYRSKVRLEVAQLNLSTSREWAKIDCVAHHQFPYAEIAAAACS
jgi:hypothetical protein